MPSSDPPDTAARRPLLLDLFCGAGGAAMGYHRAGFDVIGFDVVEATFHRQPAPDEVRRLARAATPDAATTRKAGT